VSQIPLSFDESLPDGAVEVAPGAVWVPGWLDHGAQEGLMADYREWVRPPAGLRRPRMPNGAPFSTEAVCLGWHWYPYRYSRTCDDHDGAPVKPFPPHLARLADDACRATGFGSGAYDAAIVNRYEPTSKLGLHQDKYEGDAVEARPPVVTISLGDTCVFRLAGVDRRTSPFTDVVLRSGDVLVFGGANRRIYHGVPKVLDGTGPDIGLPPGRLSITVRETGL
jgi:alkylated DNA repair protein (DNA oxidative demethylase)